ncbi:hypothetical protein PO909_027048 [Leuciscus waleckii]
MDTEENSPAIERRSERRGEGAAPCPSGMSIKSTQSMDPPISFRSGDETSEHIEENGVTGDLQDSYQAVSDAMKTVKTAHKTRMKNKYERLFEGINLQENQTLLNRIYTQLYIIEGDAKGVNEEHEILKMEKTPRTQLSLDTPIYCNDIFKASPKPGCEEKDQIKTVLTKGNAGIGKTVSVQKLILDWAEGKANQDVDFMFVLQFRELNLIKDHQCSLHSLLLDFHPELKDLDSKIYDKCKVVFIFDGLDECRITLMFSDDEKVSDVDETSSVGVLISNLIKGDLLPSAHIWITSRPAAANQIPSKYINRVTEIQGFNDPQKEEYFRKRIIDEHQASIIISHIKKSRSLHIMCHIPVFCWITSTVLQNILKQDLNAEIPQTLTEMYIRFLLIQINKRNQKYEERDPEKLLQSNRDMILKLAELAHKQLMKGNVMFYEEDLIESGIDVTDASVYSGICTEIFKEESVIHQKKVYCFIHLSFQEFLAAFYEFHSQQKPLDMRLKEVIDESLQNGALDLFLRFLLGVSLESNQRLLQDLLTHTVDTRDIIKRAAKYIKHKIKGDEQLPADKSINLFLCLLEVNDQTFYRELQEFVKSGMDSKQLSPAHCSAIAYMLQMLDEPLDELDSKKLNTSEEGKRRLIPAVRNCRKALEENGVTGELQVSYQAVSDAMKTSMKNKYERLFEGINLQENETLLNRIYTELYIIEGDAKGVNEEHEILNMEKTPRTQLSQDIPIYCNDIFKALPKPGFEEKDHIKTVLTKGNAGIGKSVSVQKLILDWAEGKAHQDVDFMFVLQFRELNLIKDHQCSLHSLVLDFHPELKELDSKIYDKCKVVFIFDGLDECRITLMFSDEKVSDVNETSSVGVLISNLIKGDLLPSAHIWITSRPAAANQIPSKYINRVTEIQGFNDPQKEEYFRRRITDEHQASIIISHIKKSRSLHIMCHIPVFCWITSTVLQNILKQDVNAEIPQTLTEMYIHFLLIQINMRNQKYEERDPEKLQSNRDMILKLAELAHKQLMKGNVMFYEKDLTESGIDVTDASVYSGICTEIFKEEPVIHQKKVYCFIHLSFQEFLAAFYEFHSQQKPLDMRLEEVIDESLQNGRLDLFLRFLLGVSLESNQRLLQDLLTHTENNSDIIDSVAMYIKHKIKGDEQLPADKSINLFLCLLEVNDQTFYREIQELVKSGMDSEKLSPAHCSAIAYMLQMLDEPLDELDSKKINTSEEGKRRLIPAVRNCRKALFSGCNLTDQCCESVATALQLNSSLRELDLSINNLEDSGGKLLFDALKSPKCQLEKLRLSICKFTDQCCESVASALQSSNSCLKELDLSNNNLKDSGVKLLSDALKSPHCKLEKLRLSGCMVTKEGCSHLASALSLNFSHLRELDLSYNHPGDTELTALKEDPNCKLEKLCLDHGGETMIKEGLQKYFCRLTLDPNTVHNRLSVVEGNQKLVFNKKPMSHPDHPERFDAQSNLSRYDGCPQVLCKERLTGRCYWEAEYSGLGDVAVAYKGNRRKGKRTDCVFGFNEKSWILSFFRETLNTWHKGKVTHIPAPSPPYTRAGVYVDEPAGTLSFYGITDTHALRHLHTFNTTFTESLYAGFVLYENSMSLCDVELEDESFLSKMYKRYITKCQNKCQFKKNIAHVPFSKHFTK